ncbi:MAG: hypothetical protein CO189_12070 [candidate division Zixibacteria bacterium CG_4_9_14_3_um_filter_46_8]|nr:MAG: hypothetical protein CO189_12070 [candidate division Zixibacteria bacterium CG_4_9_14_3_um_filter_46_8]
MAGKTVQILMTIILFLSFSKIVYAEQPPKVRQLMISEISSGEADANGDKDLNWTEPEKQHKGKSGFKAGLLSVMLPGAGEFYLGNKSRAAVFVGTEAAIWGGYLAFHTWGDWLKNDYKSYAAEHADAKVYGKDDKFFDRMQFYDSRDWFNEIEGERYGYPYPYTDYYYWHWDSPDSRKEFRKIRYNSKAAFRNATFMIGVAVVNRLASVVDAVWLSRQIKKGEGLEFYGGWRLDYNANPFANNPDASLKLSKSFN